MNEELKVIISADADKLNSEVDKAKKQIKGFADDSEASFDNFNKGLESAKKFCKTAMAAIGAAIAAASAAMVALVENTRELRNNQAKLKTAFESVGASADVATKVYDELFRVLGDDDRTTEAAAHLAKLTTNQQELSQWTEICTGIYAEFGDSLPIEGLTEAANETAKVGKVTGVLADALNWAGISEDKFNEQLEKCNSEAKREKLIRETLNKIYKTSAENYEKNNKNVLKANEAQNRLNKTMAKSGDVLEPVVTGFKEMGATILEDLEKPIKSVSKWITGTLLPALKSTYSWIKSNLPTIAGVVAGLTAGYLAYEVAVWAVKLAHDGLTAAIVLQQAAQAALNAIQAASPIGLVATALAALTAGIIAYCIAVENTIPEISVLTEEEKALMERADEVTEAFREQKAATEETCAGILSTSEHNKKLADELFNLVDANGKVKESDEARVKFILGELNNAYGTEYELVDGTIKKYGELKDTIYEVIQAKTANSMLEAKNADYVAAMEAEDVVFKSLVSSYENLGEQQALCDELNKQFKESSQELTDALATGNQDVIDAASKRCGEVSADLLIEEKNLKKLQGEYDKHLASYIENQNTIKEYEGAAMAIQEGNYTKAMDMLRKKGESHFQYADDVNEATKQAIDTKFEEAVQAGLAAEEYRTNWENGTEGYTEEMVIEAEQAYEDLLSQWATAYNDANGVGTDLGNGIKSGMSGTKSSLISYAKGLVSSILSAMRKEADSHSPSKKTMALGGDMGKGTEIGIKNSTKDVTKASKNMVAQSIKAIKGFTATNFKNMVSGSIMSARMPVASNRAISNETAYLLSSIGERLNNNTPIILQVDGKTFAETAINTINTQTKQTGTLALNIM